MNPARPVMWIDPGGMTGIAVWWPDPFAPGVLITEADFDGAADQIEQACAFWGSGLDVGWEDFHIHPKTPARDAHLAIEMIGVARRAQRKNGCRNIGPAQPDQRKKATKAMLEAIGWWMPGKDDAQSAAQHALAWMLRTGNVPNREATVLAQLRSRSGDR